MRVRRSWSHLVTMDQTGSPTWRTCPRATIYIWSCLIVSGHSSNRALTCGHGRGDRNGKAKARPVTVITIHRLDSTAMCLDNGPADGEANAHPVGLGGEEA